jgi:hypothetical protein
MVVVNGRHLLMMLAMGIGTRGDNIRDAVSKGRHRTAGLKGEDCPAHKLTERQVKSIQSEYIYRKVTYKMLSNRYGVSKGTIWFILKGKTWKNIH